MPSLQQLERLLAIDPDDAFVLYAIAQEHAKQGGHSKAIEFYDRCLAVDAAYCYAYFHKARSLEAMGDQAGVRATLEAGRAAATQSGDGKALSEISGYLSAL